MIAAFLRRILRPPAPHAGRGIRSALTELSHLPEGAEARIETNPDRKSRDMGLFPGTVVRMVRNHRLEKSLVVAAGDARLLVSRRIAARICITLS